eukprot:TRINITY_DN31458_c0_g1_i1.p2 TRINITY_DN31458_c0_g1~~TRINITY_DN31458_c0_g1_i1.p2  ORF type:complete len:169 (+),score=15.74 TRINITY_DN31458_c0_g1_i1:130-636(+)
MALVGPRAVRRRRNFVSGELLLATWALLALHADGYVQCRKKFAPEQPPMPCSLCSAGFYSLGRDENYCMDCGVQEVPYQTEDGQTQCLNCKITMTYPNADGMDLAEECGCTNGTYLYSLVCMECPWAVSEAGRGQSGTNFDSCLTGASVRAVHLACGSILAVLAVAFL